MRRTFSSHTTHSIIIVLITWWQTSKCKRFITLYFVSSLKQPWCRNVFHIKTLLGLSVTCLCFLTQPNFEIDSYGTCFAVFDLVRVRWCHSWLSVSRTIMTCWRQRVFHRQVLLVVCVIFTCFPTHPNYAICSSFVLMSVPWSHGFLHMRKSIVHRTTRSGRTGACGGSLMW